MEAPSGQGAGRDCRKALAPILAGREGNCQTPGPQSVHAVRAEGTKKFLPSEAEGRNPGGYTA
ncbi:hypothetical protein GCM10009688_21540 [Arthrobacter gandavensis]|uniref:Uncharacterized protein n=1 Tax=Arthrobacter gandavensis TaxID=169960 RepID=A0ABP5AN89_9MICC